MGNSQGEVVEMGEGNDRLDAVRVSLGMLGQSGLEVGFYDQRNATA
jgi:hypothetical protein